MSTKRQPKSTTRPATVAIPELEQSKTAVLNTLASEHSRRSYEYAIDRFTARNVFPAPHEKFQARRFGMLAIASSTAP